jgi:tetratricopeptide (TPR) repeat protein
MSTPPQPDPTIDHEPAADPLDAGLAAAFGPDSGPPLPASGSVLQALGASLPDLPRVHLREPATEGVTPVNRPGSPEMPPVSASPATAARLQFVGEIARGGMGAILKGRDADLGRDVAVKVLLETHAGKTELAQRFVEEAQITGQLQHPGIVPVYELGVFADRRPYFTMKLVKGKTLAALLAARQDVAADRPRLLGIFAQVCQALAYAHARGVIHRDLKPSNVMVGAFGEVQVMDWGLAKVLEEGGVADEAKARQQATVSVIQTARSPGSGTPEGAGSHTQAGSVLGTPAYMAPEQARGEVELVDQRADVFGLGALLCEVLTGRPPFVGKPAEAQRKAQLAQLDDAHAALEGCGADAELIALAKRCLAAQPWDRPHDAGQVAEAVTAYQHAVAERLRQAELARAAEEARAAEAQVTAAQERQARQAAQARAAAERRARRLTLGLAAALLTVVAVGAASGLWVQQQRTERRAEAARQEAQQRQEVEARLEKSARLQAEARWKEAQGFLEEARERLGESGPADLVGRVEQAQADLAVVTRLEAIRQKRVTIAGGYFDVGSADRDYSAVFQEAGLGREGDDEAVVAARVRESAIKEQLVAALDDWANVAAGRERRSWVLGVARRADSDAWRERFRDPGVWEDGAALERLAGEVLNGEEGKLAGLSPQLLTALGDALMRLGKDAVPLLKTAQERYPDDFWLNLRLARALSKANKSKEGLGFGRAAVALRPDSEVAHNNLGAALFAEGQVDEAIREWRRAIDLDPDYASPHGNLGNALKDQGKLDEAVAEYRKAIALDPKRALAHANLGDVLREQGKLDEAVAECRRAIELDPRFAPAHSNLGNALYEQGKLDEAAAEHRKAIELAPKFAMAHSNLGSALLAKGKLDEAVAEFRKAIDLDPKNAPAHNNLGLALNLKGKRDEAVAEFRKAIDLDPKNAPAHNNLGLALNLKGKRDEAVAECRRAIELDPKFAQPHSSLGLALYAQGKRDQAVAEFRKAIALDPKNAQAHCGLGVSLLEQGRFAEAATSLRRGLELLPPSHPLRASISPVLQQAEHQLALAQKLTAVLAGDSKPSPAERLEYAQVCNLKELYAGAARLYADAFAADPKLADDLRASHRYNAACNAALAGCGRGEDAKQLDDKERTRWRKRALDWLQADLKAQRGQLKNWWPGAADQARQALRHWQQDADLAGLRDPAAVAQLPADEQQACKKLWADVAALLKPAQDEPTKK